MIELQVVCGLTVKMRILIMLAGWTALVSEALSQSILFDFENATLHAPLPINITVSGLTAQFSATGQGFSIQQADTMGFTPAGFSGYCLYPSSVYLSDLLVTFSQALNDFSILYAPQELACDSSARMRVTAYLDSSVIGTSTTTADPPGTWPTAFLTFHSTQRFNRVVVHYDAPPLTGGDWGPIFMADNMTVTPAPPAPVLTSAAMLANGAFRFAFTNSPGTTVTVLGSPNLAMPLTNWTVLGGAIEISPGQFQFTDPPATNSLPRFYMVRLP